MRRSLVAGNWKMNGSLNSVQELLTNILQQAKSAEDVDVIVFPPSVYLAETQRLLANTGYKCLL